MTKSPVFDFRVSPILRDKREEKEKKKRENIRSMSWSLSSRCLRCDQRSSRVTVNGGFVPRGFINSVDSGV